MFALPSIVSSVQHFETEAAAIVQPRKSKKRGQFFLPTINNTAGPSQIKQGKLDKVGTSQHSPTINNTAGPSQSKQRKLNKAGDLQSMSNCVRRIIRKGHLYAIKEEEGRKCYAPMRLTSQNKLLLYNLRENYKPPKEAYFIKLNDVLSILDGSIKSVFMEVNTQNREESRFTVCLINKGQYAENFFHLCLGDFGPSYAGSKLLATLYKGTNLEQIRSGDYSSSNGRGGKAVVVGVNWCREKTKLMYKGHNVVTGLVAGVSNSEATVSQFSIYTGNDPTTTVRYPFGMVGEGMNVLTKAISECAEGIQLKIKNCGCIIPIADGTDCDLSHYSTFIEEY